MSKSALLSGVSHEGFFKISFPEKEQSECHFHWFYFAFSRWKGFWTEINLQRKVAALVIIFFFFGGVVLSNYATKSIIIHTSFSIYVNTSACTIAKSKGSWIKIKFIAITKLLSKQLYQLTSLLTKHSNVYFLAHSQTLGIKLFNPC